jgi:hypothetical protein
MAMALSGLETSALRFFGVKLSRKVVRLSADELMVVLERRKSAKREEKRFIGILYSD